MPHRAFVAGATSFTGRALAAQDPAPFETELALQVRPGSSNRAKLGDDPRVVEVSLDDDEALAHALEGFDTVVQLVGTVRARFAEDGDYERVDYGTTVSLLRAAKRAGVGHFVLLSSVAASWGVGAYLAWKKRTEQAVFDSGIPATVLRPSQLLGDSDFPERKARAGTAAFFHGLVDSPLGRPFARAMPINIQLLARIHLAVISDGPPSPGPRILEGMGLFRLAQRHGLGGPTYHHF